MKKVLPLWVMLLIIVICQGCSDNIDKSTATFFYLGSDFTIDSVDGKYFESMDKSLIYDVNGIEINGINSERKEIGTIVDELNDAIETELAIKNVATNTTYNLGDAVISSGDVDYEEELVIKFDIEIKETISSRRVEGVYYFVIKFNGDEVPPTDIELNFYLGDRLTIDSIDSKSFISDNSYLNYSVENISSVGKDSDTIIDQLVNAISVELDRKSGITYTLGSAELSGDLEANKKLVVKFDIEIIDIASSNKIADTYSFSISFKEETTSWNGKDRTLPDKDIFGSYLIKTPANLAWLSDQTMVDKNVLFLSDIDMNHKSFKGIKEFTGIFDGNHKSIKNLNINTDEDITSDIATALIQNVTGDTTIKNLTLDGGKISGNKYVASFVGTVGTVDTIDTIQYVFTIDNSTSNIELTTNNLVVGVKDDMIMGGFVAIIHNRTVFIRNSRYSGKIRSNSIPNVNITIGGFIGIINNSNITMKNLDKSNVIESTTVGTNTIGGIIGSSRIAKSTGFSINGDNLTNRGKISSNNSIVGGIIGQNYFNSNGIDTLIIEDTKNEANIVGSNIIGGVIGLNISGSIIIRGTFNTGVIESNNTINSGSIGGIIGKNDNVELLEIVDTYNNGEIFGNSQHTGGIIGQNIVFGTTEIRNSFNSGVITGNKYTGGIIGENNTDSTVTILDTYNAGEIINSNAIYSCTGGFIGYNKADETFITNSHNKGSLTINSAVSNDIFEVFIGGIIGMSQRDVNINNSYNIGDIETITSASMVTVGGIIGFGSSLNISESYNTGDISSSSSDSVTPSRNNYVGGVIGSIINKGTANRNALVKITDSYNVGDIESKGIAGGIIGDNYFKGINNNKLEISHSFSYGDIEADKNTGAIIGNEFGTTTRYINNYWYAPTTPTNGTSQLGGYELDVNEFKISTNFIGWLVNEEGGKWEILEDGNYPTLVNNKEGNKEITNTD